MNAENIQRYRQGLAQKFNLTLNPRTRKMWNPMDRNAEWAADLYNELAEMHIERS